MLRPRWAAPQKRKLRSSWIERCNRGAPSARFRRRVAIVQNVRSAGEYFAHDLTLHSDTTAVDNTYGAKSQSSRLLQIGFHHPLHIARRYTVQIEHIADGNADGLVRIRKIVRHAISLYGVFPWLQSIPYKEGQYLAYIHLYTKLHKRPPAEFDIQMYFQLTPSVHNMIVTLEARGPISRIPWTPRTIQVLPRAEELPKLD